MKTIYKTDELIGKSKGGLCKYWVGMVNYEGGNYYLSTSYWHEKADGSLSQAIYSIPVQVEGKNIGRKNETSPLDQALSQLKSMVALRLKKGYSLSHGDFIEVISKPMLSKKLNLKKLEPVVYIQPKLDGMRCLTDMSQSMYSRNSDLIRNHPNFDINIDSKYELDGELLLPHPYTFQQSISCIKKRNKDTDLLEYWVFDLIVRNEPSLTFSERWKILQSLDIGNKAKLVPTERIENPTEVLLTNMMYQYILSGYEGLIVRLDHPYCIGHRSDSLMKMKSFDDNEFKIIDGKEGSGNDKGCVIFTCVIDGGQQFEVRPKGSVEYRKELLINLPSLIGKYLTVRYQGYTDEGLPRFPVGISIRDYE